MLSTLVGAGRADGSPLSRARTRDADALAYDLQFVACLAMLEKAAAADPLGPAPQGAIAAVTWMELLFAARWPRTRNRGKCPGAVAAGK